MNYTANFKYLNYPTLNNHTMYILLTRCDPMQIRPCNKYLSTLTISLPDIPYDAR